MKVCILFTFRDGPWGGCNQFLTGLRDAWKAAGALADRPEDADAVLFDSLNEALPAIALKLARPGTPFVHRLDGPISSYRGRDRDLDAFIHHLNAAVADGTIFQSEFSRRANLALGMRLPASFRVITNAPRGDCFFPGPTGLTGKRPRILCASFSPNWKKGFDVLRHLDAHLDFGRYDMTFVGNSPIAFTNIRRLPPQDSAALGRTMREHDLFLTASRDDPCSNALIEAQACGLPVAALASGGHPELVGAGGALFTGTDDVLAAIETVAAGLPRFAAAIPARSMAATAAAYLDFLGEVRETARPPKTLGRLGAWTLVARYRAFHIRQTLAGLVNKRS